MKQGIEYVAEVKILDRLRLNVVQAFVRLILFRIITNIISECKGILKRTSFSILFSENNEFVNLVYSRGPLDSLYISFYKPFKEVPDPPSMLLPEKTLDYEPEQVVAYAIF